MANDQFEYRFKYVHTNTDKSAFCPGFMNSNRGYLQPALVGIAVISTLYYHNMVYELYSHRAARLA